MRFESSEEKRPRDALPVLVVIRVDRRQDFGVVAARATASATSAAAAAAFVVWVSFVAASPKIHENNR